ncbi:MAG: isoprenylcysteine carboxylmethyltransferase family protein [Anaerolineales bacterium]|nr:isoprenylcysteine carboxylmethyltransferase family protein [Anaerolineales bacterium]
MREIAFTSMLIIEILIGISFVITWMLPGFRIWPPPSRRSWQFYYVWTLIDFSYLAYIAIGFFDWNSFILVHWLRFLVGSTLIIGGVGLVIWGLKTLSYQTSLGLSGEFVEAGPYRLSRNPQYVGFILLIIGYAILTDSWMAWICGLIGAGLFGLTPLLEEPWLEEKYGESYKDYKQTVPRFLGRRKNLGLKKNHQG